jgi:ABC-type nitrate/sulfonate/bicarbonate transport system permease component
MMAAAAIARAWSATWRPLATFAVLLAAAELAKRAGALPVFVPSPSQVVGEAIGNPRLIYENIGQTAWRAAVGYAIAAGVAIAAGSIAVLLHRLHGAIYNVGVALNSIPIIAMAPLLASWIGNGSQLQITIAAFASQFAILVGTMQGLRAADARQRELLHVLSASRPQVLRFLLIPSALPYLFAGFKIAAPSAVLGAITAEWAGADRGVGAMMLYALFAYDTPKVWLSVFLTCILAASGYGLWVLIERIAIYWDQQAELAE